MKKIINGKKYDTETAEYIGGYEYGNGGDFSHYKDELYRKKTGEFFLYGEGGPMSKYSEETGQNEWSGGEVIQPLSDDEAKEFGEKVLDADKYEAVFGPVEE